MPEDAVEDGTPQPSPAQAGVEELLLALVDLADGFEGAPGTVVDEAARGYLWKDELLRPARVRVAE